MNAPPIAMQWCLSNRADRRARALADRHYNRQRVGTRQFVPPGRCIVLLSKKHDALWVSSYPYAAYVRHAWAGAWICSCFRNESACLSSVLIMQAVAVTRQIWGAPPEIGMITFVDTRYVRKKRDWGRCYRKAGWQHVGYTKGGLVVLQILPEAMPLPAAAYDAQLPLFDVSGQEAQHDLR